MAATRQPTSLAERIEPGQSPDLAPKHRAHQESPRQPTKHSLLRRILAQRQPGAPVVRKAPKWRREKQHTPHQRQQAPRERTSPILKPVDTPVIVEVIPSPVSGFALQPTLKQAPHRTSAGPRQHSNTNKTPSHPPHNPK
ncbi:Hypothetical predicted protein [Pelobates cultripes]|uniref:Uncharacterized protein n=1 Tax=Pelobates cultripes TaxID=61616 RepID=A0AAD1WLJ0_PELCU|nr:Hypothetical predicted protein [Pelobates cultripes]